MIWTKECPREIGWYWCRRSDEDGVPWIVACPGPGQLPNTGESEYRTIELEWAGPLLPPQEERKP